MGFFSKLFAKKKGGTTVGNAIRLTPASMAIRGARSLWNRL